MSARRVLYGVAVLAFLAVVLVVALSGDSKPAPDPLEQLPAPAVDGAPSPPAPSVASNGVLKAIWGPVEMPNGGSAFPVYERLGVDAFQIQLRWADVAASRPADPADPADPSYRWPPEIDLAIREGGRRGIDVAVLVTTTPGWANGGRAEIRAPDDVGDFAAFLGTAAVRYPEVSHWMIWGEPNRRDRFLPNRPNDPVGPRRYAELLDATYGALKETSEEDIVIGGNLFTGGDVKPPDFIRWMRLPSGRPPRLDWFGANPYPFRLPDLADPPRPGGWRDLSDLDTLGREVDAAYQPLGIRPRLWLSEFTVQSSEDSRYFAYHVSEAEQADWLRAGYAAAEEAGDVAGLGWFKLLDRSLGSEVARWGLMTAGGRPKPAYRAYASILGH